MRLAGIAKNIGMQKLTFEKMLIIPEDTGFVQFLLHKSKLKFMLERKVSIVLNEKCL